MEFGNKRPTCANPQCEGGAVVGIGRLFYCGECAMKVQKIQEEKTMKEEAYILERLQNGTVR